MKVKAVINKVEKALGVKVNHPSGGHGNYWASYGEHILSWHSNGAMGIDSDASGYHVRRTDDHSDPQTDYFAGFFADNATQMIRTVKPDPPKFKIGTLIRFKDNKRSERWGVAGKLAIVTAANGGGMCSVRLNDGTGAKNGPFAANSYYERDMEIAKSRM